LLVFFPYLFQHLVETGMVGMQILCLLVTYWLIRVWFSTPRLDVAIAVALVTFVGIWTKLSFGWYAPALLVLVLATAYEHRLQFRNKRPLLKILGHGLIGLAILVALSSVLFLSTDPRYPTVRPYWDLAFNSPYSETHSLRQLLQIDNLRRLELWGTLWNPLRATERVFQPDRHVGWSILYSTFLYGAAPLLWVLMAIRDSRASRASIVRSMTLYGCFLITLYMVFRIKESWGMHHTLLAYPFLILSVAVAIEGTRSLSAERPLRPRFRTVAAAFLVAFVGLNAYAFSIFPSQKVDVENDASRIEINERLQDPAMAENYFYVVIDWGMYFYQGLYGPPSQSVLWVSPTTLVEVTALKRLQAEYGRKFLFIYHPDLSAHNLPLLQRYFDVRPCKLTSTVDPDGSDWIVLIEVGGEDNVCL
jgi:hypothetical protein